MNLDILAQFLALVSCAVIAWRAESAINHMSRCTPFLIRLAFWLILVSSAAALAMIVLHGDVPPWPAVFGSMGAACLLFCERRLRALAKQNKSRLLA